MSLQSDNWFDEVRGEDCVRMDVRPTLARGIDPLEDILARVRTLSATSILMVEAPFDPVPLRRLMAGKGYDSHAVQRSEKHWQAFFKKCQTDTPPELPELPDLPAFPMIWREGTLEMDLRGLVPPNPMIAILQIIENGEGGDEFTVWLDRDPVYLYPELAERSWTAKVIEESPKGLYVKVINNKGHDKC